MALALKTPLEQEFTLEKAHAKYEANEPTKVRFIQATQGAVELHDHIFSAVKKLYRKDSIQVQGSYSFMCP